MLEQRIGEVARRFAQLIFRGVGAALVDGHIADEAHVGQADRSPGGTVGRERANIAAEMHRLGRSRDDLKCRRLSARDVGDGLFVSSHCCIAEDIDERIDRPEVEVIRSRRTEDWNQKGRTNGQTMSE